MNKSEVLEKAIQKAIDAGWSPTMDVSRKWRVDDILNWYNLGPWAVRLEDDINYLKFIFNHDFAKALWSEELWWTAHPGKSGESRREYELPAWQMHLQQMVIAEDPIVYLAAHMPQRSVPELPEANDTQKTLKI
jgi:hypothetical protein